MANLETCKCGAARRLGASFCASCGAGTVDGRPRGARPLIVSGVVWLATAGGVVGGTLVAGAATAARTPPESPILRLPVAPMPAPEAAAAQPVPRLQPEKNEPAPAIPTR